MPSEKLFTIAQARTERDELANKIRTLIEEYEYYVRGVAVQSIAVTRQEKTDRRGEKSKRIQCIITVTLRPDSGFGSDL